MAIELKTDEGSLSKLQSRKLQEIAHAGGVALVVTPENWEESYEFLKNVNKTKNGDYLN